MQKMHEKQLAHRAHMQAFVDRFRASAAKARQALYESVGPGVEDDDPLVVFLGEIAEAGGRIDGEGA